MPTPEIIENAIYSTEELSELFGIPQQNMRLLVKRGHIKGAKIGKNWFVTGKALLQVFEESDTECGEDDNELLSEEDTESEIRNKNEF